MAVDRGSNLLLPVIGYIAKFSSSTSNGVSVPLMPSVLFKGRHMKLDVKKRHSIFK